MDTYILEGKEAKLTRDLIKWSKSMTLNRTVDKTQIGEVLISTVFLGLNHSFDESNPLLFETMIFGGKENGFQYRYSTWDEAVEGHKKAIELVNSQTK